MPLPLRPLLLLGLGLALLGARCSATDVVFGVPRSDGTLPVQVLLHSGQSPASVRVTLDGVDVSARFTPGGEGLLGDVPLPPPGESSLAVESVLPGGAEGLLLPVVHRFALHAPAPTPGLAGFDPAPVLGRLPASAWLRLRFTAAVPAEALAGVGFGIECGGDVVPRRIHATANAVILDPLPQLPAGALCRVAWRGESGAVQEAAFETAPAAGTALRVLHDRDDPLLVAPFPDDYFVTADAATPTGRRLAIAEPPYTGALRDVYRALLTPVNRLDGFSRISPLVIAVSSALDPSLLPGDEAAAQDPFSALALFDVDPASPEYGQRIPFVGRFRTDVNQLGQVDHAITLFPSIAFRPRGRYALVVTRRLFAAAAAGRPLQPSDFFARAAGPPVGGESPAVSKARESIAAVLDFLETVPAVPIAREDVALAVRLSIRSDDDIPRDLQHIKETILAAPPPPLSILSSSVDGQLRTTLRGTVKLTSFLHPVLQQMVRDPGTGRPLPQGTEDVPFVLRLPAPSSPGPAPIVLYQHGNPGSPEEIVRNDLNGYLVGGGYAVGGIADYLNRRIGGESAQIGATFFFLLQTYEVPKFWNQTGADMLGFLRALQGLSGTAWRPPGTATTPLLDTTRLLYHGISEGGNNALRFLPFAPEILAATPTVGGGRLVEILLHQNPTLLQELEGFVAGARSVQTLTGLSLFQHAYDDQDPHSFARFLYRAPLSIAGLPGARPPSLLWTEGIGDSFVPNNATRSAARELGIPSVRRLRRSSPVLQEVDAPLSANLAPDRTGGHFQYDPASTPGCGAGEEGHYCPQTAPLAQAQRLHFFTTARAGPAPEIVDPLP